jgi:hypothetical protein
VIPENLLGGSRDEEDELEDILEDANEAEDC